MELIKIDMKILDNPNFKQTSFQNILNNIICESSLINESLYEYDLFSDFIDLCFKQFLNKQTVQEYSANKIYDLIENYWKYKKQFNKNKDLIICFCNNSLDLINKLKIFQFLTFSQITDCILSFENDFGFIVKDFQKNKDKAIIILNLERCNTNELIIKYLVHQFIHYLQWNTGKSLHVIKEINLNNLDKEKIQSLQNFYHKENFQIDINNIFKNIILNNVELETYIQTFYYDLKNICIKNNILFDKLFLQNFIKIFEVFNKQNNYEEYFNNIKSYLNSQHILNLIETNEFIIILLIFYFNLKVNTFKNHLFSYYLKENSK